MSQCPSVVLTRFLRRELDNFICILFVYLLGSQFVRRLWGFFDSCHRRLRRLLSGRQVSGFQVTSDKEKLLETCVFGYIEYRVGQKLFPQSHPPLFLCLILLPSLPILPPLFSFLNQFLINQSLLCIEGS